MANLLFGKEWSPAATQEKWNKWLVDNGVEIGGDEDNRLRALLEESTDKLIEASHGIGGTDNDVMAEVSAAIGAEDKLKRGLTDWLETYWYEKYPEKTGKEPETLYSMLRG